MTIIEVGEFFSTDYPTLEGGFTIETNDPIEELKALAHEYAYIDVVKLSDTYYVVKVYGMMM